MKGYLKPVMLKILSEDWQSGYSLIKAIKERTACWKPSTGSIYPLLETMLGEGLVTAKPKENKTMYRLTEKGKGELKAIVGKAEFRQGLISELSIIRSLSDRGVRAAVDEAIRRIERTK